MMPPEADLPWRCVDCGSALGREPGHEQGQKQGQSAWSCPACKRCYGVCRGIPVFMRADNSIFPPESYVDAGAVGIYTPTLARRIAKLLPSPSINLAAARMLRAVAARVPAGGLILVIGSGVQRREIGAAIGNRARLVFVDVDISADVDAFADAHDLPIADASFDAVLQTAVLEHVLYPEAVIAEMRRVLRSGGLVYSELPFMQQVHEGAYDFYRATLTGHRRWFNAFEEIEAGVLAGPATTLLWALEHFFLAFSPRRLKPVTKAAVRLLFFWLKYLDYLLQRSSAMVDGASGTYFFGRLGSSPTPDKLILARYSGSRSITHT